MLEGSVNVMNKMPYLLLFLMLIYICKPVVLFKPNGKLRVYGVGYDEEGYKKTFYNMHYVIILIILLLEFFAL